MSDAWRTAGPQLAESPGADVLVVGGDAGPNSIGLYAVGIAMALGAGRVVYVDDDTDRLGIAARFGAETVEGPPPAKAGAFPITVDASGSAEGIRCAVEQHRLRRGVHQRGRCWTDPPLPLFAMYSRCCTFHIGRAHVRPAIPAVLALAGGGVDRDTGHVGSRRMGRRRRRPQRDR